MIPRLFRKIAMQVHFETGKSVQDIFQEAVLALKTRTEFKKHCPCPLCASHQTEVKNTKKEEGKTIRQHKCTYCGFSFVSEQPIETPDLMTEKKSILSTEKDSKPIAPKKKKPHIKNRKG